MEGKKSDAQRQMKKTENKETSSHYGSEFHKNSDELVTLSGAKGGETTSESVNGILNLDRHLPKNNPLVELAKKNDVELLRQIMGEQESRSVNVNQMAAEGIGWWTKRMDKMSREEFQQFYAALGIFRERTQTHLQQRLRIRDSNSAETSTSNRGTNGRVRHSHRR